MSEEQTATPVSTEVDSQESIIARLTDVLESPEDKAESPEEEQDVVDETTDEVVEEPEEDEEESAESEEVEEDPTEDEEEESEPEFVTEGNVQIDGETLSVEEIKLGYLRQSDYTKKTQAVAEQRKANDDQSQHYESTLSALLTSSGADLSRFQNVNWEQAAVENPEQYKQAKAAFEQTQKTYNNIKLQSDEHQQRMQQQTKTANKERAEESLTVLKSTIPNWNNDLYYSIGEYAKEALGVDGEEFNDVHDHRLITALYKAMQFDRAKVETQKKVKATPKKTLSGKKAEPKSLGKKDNYRKARDRLKTSGSMEDAVQALLNKI